MIERVLIVHVQRGLRIAQREKVPANLPHVSSQLGVTVITPSIERVVSGKIHKTLPSHDCSCEKKYQALSAFLYYK